MSQKVARKGAVTDDKDKTDTPVKDMKKKMAANAEKEKHAADKTEKEKAAEKQAEKKSDKTEQKVDKKPAEKSDKTEKVEKKIVVQEKPKEDNKGESSGKDKEKRSETNRSKQNGKPHNGVSEVTLTTNGVSDVANGNGAVSDTDDEPLAEETDELFPELSYDDTSDAEYEAAPEAPSRSLTRRSQAKVTRTPETPRPASDKQADKEDESKDSKIPKLKDDAQSTERKLRSSDSPKPAEAKKVQETKKTQDLSKKTQEETKKESGKSLEKDADKTVEKLAESAKSTSQEPKKDENNVENKENADKSIEVEVEIVIENESGQESRKPDTNYSKSRVKVSPYRRSMRLADQTISSVTANYTGNNTTMEMDITESSLMSETSVEESYLGGLRAVRGRRSYRLLGELPPRRSPRPAPAELPSRPTGTVVGRKRRAGGDAGLVAGVEAVEAGPEAGAGKRARLVDRITQPFRSLSHMHLPRRTPEIVGINSDLPLTAPVASAETFDPEVLKPELEAAVPGLQAASSAFEAAAPAYDKDSKRCVVM